MAIFQFIVSGVGSLALGKKQKMKKLIKKTIEVQLQAIPHFPSEKREGGMGSRRKRLVMKQPMERM